jgi:CxxC-x17-CxxC domain-containing protein
MLTQQDNSTQLIEQMRKINERLYMLERKMDVLADLLKPKTPDNRPAPRISQPLNPMDLYIEVGNEFQHNDQPDYQPKSQHNHQHNQNNHQHKSQHNNRPKERPMYSAVCADCQKECSLPFKPRAERPVYCKDCFSRRKNSNTHKPKEEGMPQVVSQVQPAAVSVIPEIKINKVKKTKTASKSKKKSVVVKKASSKKASPKKSKRK